LYGIAQINKNIELPNSINQISQSIIVNENKFIIGGGLSYSPGNQFRLLMITDSIFNIRKYYTYSDSVSLITAGYSKTVKTATGYSLLLNRGDTNNIISARLLFLNDSLNLLFYKDYFAATGFIELLQLYPHPYGGFVMTGEIREVGSPNKDIVILRTDSAGNELWRKIYGVAGEDESPGRLIHLNNEDYIMGCGKRIEYSNGSVSYVGNLLKYSNNVFQEKTVTSEWQSEGISSLLKLSNSLFMGVGTKSDGTGNSELPNQKSTHRFFLFDNNLNILKDSILDTNYRNIKGLYQLTRYKGQFLAAGRTLDDNNLPVPFYMMLDSTGKVHWRQSFQAPGYPETANPVGFGWALYDMLITEQNEIVGCGYTIHPTEGQQIWVFKTDSNGCMIECNYLNTPKPPEANDVSGTLYPNPATDVVHIRLPEGKALQNVRIYDMQGKEVRYINQVPAGSTTTLSVQNLPPGLYVLKSDTEYWKFVKE
jgi:hypothetical protein